MHSFSFNSPLQISHFGGDGKKFGRPPNLAPSLLRQWFVLFVLMVLPSYYKLQLTLSSFAIYLNARLLC